MFLKVMSGENLPDGDSRKTFTLHCDVTAVEFSRKNDAAAVKVYFEEDDPETFPLLGNVYLMNNEGKTIAMFGPR